MSEIIQGPDQSMRGKIMWAPGTTEEMQATVTSEPHCEHVGATELEEGIMQVQRRRRAWRVAGGAIAGMMAARRVVQEIGDIGTNDLV